MNCSGRADGSSDEESSTDDDSEETKTHEQETKTLVKQLSSQAIPLAAVQVANESPARLARRASRTSSVERLPTPDLAEKFVPRRARVLIFFILCQGVQMFMSYDGGALPASLPLLEKMTGNGISHVQLGFLNAMDKVGIVVGSVPWGWALRRCPAKLLLMIGLLINAGCTVFFGFIYWSIPLMYLFKFIMGATQALQAVWGSVWTVGMAPPDRKSSWMALGCISAGVGTGIGTMIAGIGTDQGLPYWCSFLVSGATLCLFWVMLIFFPGRWLSVQMEEYDELAVEDQPPEDSLSLNGRSEFMSIWCNKVYLWTTICIALTQFEAAGFQFLFILSFPVIWSTGPGEDEHLNQSWVTSMYLVVAGGGGFLGVAFGPILIDKFGGYTPRGVIRSLSLLLQFQLVAAAAGILGVYTLYAKCHTTGYSGVYGDVWLWLTWLAVLLVMAAQSACVAALCVINIQVFPEHQRTRSSSMEMAFRNIFGMFGGNILPSIAMQLNSESTINYQYGYGLGFIFAMNFIGAPMVGAARHAAQAELAQTRHGTILELRDAIQSEDVERLKEAVKTAKSLELEELKDGRIVIDMANEVIGQKQAESKNVDSPSPGTQSRLAELEHLVGAQADEIRRQREQLARQREEIRQLRGVSTE